MTLNNYINKLFNLAMFAFFVGIVVDPTSVGEWKAQVDIGYDMIWSEYLMDYSCGEEN